MFHRALTIAILLLALTAVGCQTVDRSRMNDDGLDRMPWNERQGWEDSTLGVPF